MITEAQREERKRGIGGSDASVIMGTHPTKTLMDLWLDKTGQADESQWDGESSDFADAGTFIEGGILDWTAKKLGCFIEKSPPTVVHAQHEWMRGNLDGYVKMYEVDSPTSAIVECKALFDWARIRAVEETQEPLPWHRTQGVHYLACTGLPSCVFAYFYEGRLNLLEVARDEEEIATLVEAERRFWFDHVLAEKEPPLTEPSDRIASWRRRYAQDDGRIETSEGPALDAARKVAAARKMVGEAMAAKEAAEAELVALLGTAAGFDFGANGKVTARTQFRQTIDGKGLRKAHPRIADEFTRTSTSRPLYVRLRGEEEA